MLVRSAVFALSLGLPCSVVVQDVPDEAPPILGVEGQLLFFSFLVVMLVVPWMMARDAPGEEPVGSGEPGRASMFSSPRERRLWLWTTLVMLAILSTLTPVQQVAVALRARNLLGLASFAFLLVVLVIVGMPWLRRRPGRREIAAALGVAVVYLATLIRLPVPEARSHLFEYGLVAILVYQALAERRRNGRRVPAPALMAVVATALIGWFDELVQAFLPNRVYDLADVGFNALAAFMAVSASLFMAWARGWDVVGRLRRRL